MNSPQSSADALKQARARLRAQDPHGAVNALKAALAEDGRSAEIVELLGVAQGMAGNTSASRAAFEEATKLDPARATAHYNYAVVLSRDGELENALEEVNTAVFLDPKHQGAAQLRTQLAQQIRDRRYIGEEAFQTVPTSAKPDPSQLELLGRLPCGVCGKKNLFSARVCRHCGTFIKEMPDVEIVE